MLVKILVLQAAPGKFCRLADMGVSMLATFGTRLQRTVKDFEEVEVRVHSLMVQRRMGRTMK